MEKRLLSEKIKKFAESVGIDAIGFAEASEFSDYRLSQHQRRNPKLTLPNAKSIIIAGIYIGSVTQHTYNLLQAGCYSSSLFLVLP